jgi:hypothetical protein
MKAVPPADAPPPQHGLLPLLRVVSGFSSLSMAAAAAIATLTLAKLGPTLAMGVAMYGGNTEPLKPELAFPWVLSVLALLVLVGGMVLERRGQLLVGTIVAHGGALFALVVPFIHLWRLVGRTG